ncbi:MAG: UPF0261 family protein [Proteobacteria bacterium]|nr:UPF0261 family protein [Pseudomonadota bacterium]
MATIAVLGTLDTKGVVHQYLSDCIKRRGHRTLLVDVGLQGTPQIRPDFAREEVLLRAGRQLGALHEERSRAAAVMSESLGQLLLQLFLGGGLDGVVTAGGLCGGRIVGNALGMLPFGLPSVLVSHLSGDKLGLKRVFKDMVLVPSLLEPDSLNRVVRPALIRAAGAVCGMVEFGAASAAKTDRPLVVASQLGQLDSGVSRSYGLLQDAGMDVHPFTGKGLGGRLMDAVVGGRYANGVLDFCLSDVADAVVGGAFPATHDRMDATARTGVPCVVVPGGTDVVHLRGDSIPKSFEGRHFLDAGDGLVMMRTSPQECIRIGEWIATKVNACIGPATVCLPLRGVSEYSVPGQAFHDPEADRALFDGIRQKLRTGVRLQEVKATIEDAPFAKACAEALLENIAQRNQDHSLIRRVEVFKLASETLLSEASRMLERLFIEAGAFVQQQGVEADGFYLLLQGRAEILRNGERVTQVGPGAVFGENSLMFGVPDAESVRAQEPCELLLLRHGSFERLLDRHPDLEERLAAIIQARLRRS